MHGSNTIRLIPLAALWLAVAAPSVRGQTSEPLPEIRGQALFEKVPVTSLGLDPAATVRRPIRDAVVEVVDPGSGSVLWSAETDEQGRFVLPVPRGKISRIRVLSQLVSDDVVVLDNTAGSAVWAVWQDVEPGEEIVLIATDASRSAGAFNILDVIRRANAFVGTLEADLELPPLRVFWSPLNTDDPDNGSGRFVGGTRFYSRAGYAVVLGDRSSDSDEFDDDVILHEYAHFLAARFSRDDSIGGPHAPGDVLDPRVAWSEGWADFFPALVDGDPIYRDSFADRVLEYDLEANFGESETPGYWSERTVHSFLWDLADDADDSGDMVTLDPGSIWRAFRSLSGDAFVYLPTFLDQLAAQPGVDGYALEQLARMHSLDYRFGATRRTPEFPKAMEGVTATGELDSWSLRRANLARSAHLYRFGTSGGAVTIDLDITGLGSARNPAANDLDLLLMDADGQILRVSAGGGDGMPERIATFLPEGSYVVEVRSFSRQGAWDTIEFNSATYRLTVIRP